MTRTRALATVAAASAALLALGACSSGDTGDDDGLGLVRGGTLTVATEGTYRPFSYHDDSGELVGYDVEVAEAVAEKLGLETEFAETQWDAIFAGLDAGRFDTIANQVTITPEREEQYAFSAPYTVSRGAIVVTEDNDDISSFDDLEGKTTAQSLTSNWRDLAEESGAEIENVEGWAQSISLLRNGRVDATINDTLTYLDYVNENADSGLKIAAETDETSESAFVVTPEREALAEEITGALEELRAEGTLAELSEKYFGDDVSE
ncbi:amino acid ABC transporter substrate-binding protein [Myceligenerans pegani]|uniref:Amino acid ABC transporter substrate-binding protein n=1 Tax=Myceligenerans pegani TaxID=2776917 RepID=A0ABR9N173_9MICO|nr:amino acid ABC transporter substrate-binding protein [Myceligenerans sp. TRM 65318]MBE1877031.1 amino acid ABC transporter substrate-binding protein [Myceligenerans sp. TRM 65318]MBE3019302.1 amino acid ABC transporter substrate-binding protein [Myceligenerans sp. TRM 65318]